MSTHFSLGPLVLKLLPPQRSSPADLLPTSERLGNQSLSPNMPGPFDLMFLNELTKGSNHFRVFCRDKYFFHKEKQRENPDWAYWDEYVIRGRGLIRLSLG